MLGYDYIISNVKGLNSDSINNKIESRAFGIEMKMKNMEQTLYPCSDFIMENSLKHKTSKNQMSQV